jgi:hypothetical protein
MRSVIRAQANEQSMSAIARTVEGNPRRTYAVFHDDKNSSRKSVGDEVGSIDNPENHVPSSWPP